MAAPLFATHTIAQVIDSIMNGSNRRTTEDVDHRHDFIFRTQMDRATEALRAAVEARQNAERKAAGAQQRADDEAGARREAQREAAEARRELEAVEEERKKAEERWRKGVPPEFAPTRAEVNAMRTQYGYTQDLRHFALVGRSGAGKSSLINALRGMTNADPGAAPVGVDEATAGVTRYSDPSNPKCVWYDISGAETLDAPDWQYFKDQGFYLFDAIIVLYADRFTSTDIALLRTCRKCSIPTFIVCSKSDQYIRNIRRGNGYETDPEDYHSRFSPAFVRAEEKARDKYIKDTTLDVKKNLAVAGLRLKRVYLVSRLALMKVVKGETAGAAIDEHDLHGDIVDVVEGA